MAGRGAGGTGGSGRVWHAATALAIATVAVALTTFGPWIGTYAAARRSIGQWLPDDLRSIDEPLLWALAAFAGAMIAARTGPRGTVAELGLGQSPAGGILLALIAALPLIVGGWFVGRFDPSASLLAVAVVRPVGEELLLRGLLVGQLTRRAGWGVLAAGLVPGVIYGALRITLAVLRGSEGPGVLADAAMVTVSGLFMAWLLARWGGNLWIPLLMHVAIALAWSSFNLGEELRDWEGATLLACAAATAAGVTVTAGKARR